MLDLGKLRVDFRVTVMYNITWSLVDITLLNNMGFKEIILMAGIEVV